MASKVLWAQTSKVSELGSLDTHGAPPSHRAFPPGCRSPPHPSCSLPRHRETAKVEVIQNHALDGPAPLGPRIGVSRRAPGLARPHLLN